MEQMCTMMSDFISAKVDAIDVDDIFATLVLSLRKRIRNLDLALHPANIIDCDNIKQNLQHVLAWRDFKHSDFFLQATALATDSQPKSGFSRSFRGKSSA